MGKVTGFMEFERVNETYEAPAQRIHHYKEFVLALEDAEAQVQGARCMDCGIPFCNNGCPVNNIIPDFNDLVFHGDWKKTHEIVIQGLKILENLDHRGAVGADPLMGDGAGILIQIPDQLYREDMALQGVILPPLGEYGL